MTIAVMPSGGLRAAATARALALFVLAILLLAGCDSPVGPGGKRNATRSLAVGEQHACVLTEAGDAYCWGSNAVGQLGTGSLTSSVAPATVVGGHRFVAIYAGGRHTCALTEAGDAYCWGANANGELGIGRSSGGEWEPTLVAGGLKFTSLSVGGFQHTCGRTRDGQLHCWGGDRDRQLGFATTETCPFGASTIGCSRAPRPVPLSGEVSAVSAGFLHTCALRSGGVATCWGDNSAGQLGTGATGLRVAPTDVAGPVRFASLASGSLHGCGLDAAGRAFCWGDGSMGLLGTSSTTASLTPAAVSGGLSFRQISASRGNTVLGHTCAVADDGRAYCWGSNSAGQLGSGNQATQTCQARVSVSTCATAPLAVSGTERWAAIAAGAHFTCGISTAGAAYCWGVNATGQLGNGGTQSASTPQPVTGGLRLPRSGG